MLFKVNIKRNFPTHARGSRSLSHSIIYIFPQFQQCLWIEQVFFGNAMSPSQVFSANSKTSFGQHIYLYCKLKHKVLPSGRLCLKCGCNSHCFYTCYHGPWKSTFRYSYSYRYDWICKDFQTGRQNTMHQNQKCWHWVKLGIDYKDKNPFAWKIRCGYQLVGCKKTPCLSNKSVLLQISIMRKLN